MIKIKEELLAFLRQSEIQIFGLVALLFIVLSLIAHIFGADLHW